MISHRNKSNKSNWSLNYMIAIFIKSLNLAEETPYYIINNSLTDCSDPPLVKFQLKLPVQSQRNREIS